MADKVDFFQIYYEDKFMTAEARRAEIFPFAKQYFNEWLDCFFENGIVAGLVTTSEADKIAVCSWALRQKMTMRIPPRGELTPEVLQTDFDVMSFSKNSADHDMLGALDVWHPGSSDILKMIFSELGIQMPKRPRFPIYQNAFCARSHIYKDYVKNFLIPAMEVMETVERIKVLCWRDCNYRRTTLNKPIDLERIKSFLGVDYYPFHPFLLERCFSLWIDDKNLNVVYL